MQKGIFDPACGTMSAIGGFIQPGYSTPFHPYNNCQSATGAAAGAFTAGTTSATSGAELSVQPQQLHHHYHQQQVQQAELDATAAAVPPSPPPLAPKRQCRSLTLLRDGLHRPVPVRPPGPLLEFGIQDLRLCVSTPPPPPPPPPPPLPLQQRALAGSPQDSLSPRSFPDSSPGGSPTRWNHAQLFRLSSPLQLHQHHQHPLHQQQQHQQRRRRRQTLRRRWGRHRPVMQQPMPLQPPPEPPLPSAGRSFLIGLPHIACSPSPLGRHDANDDYQEDFMLAEDSDFSDDGEKEDDGDSGCEDVRGVELDVDEIESDL